MMSQFLMGIGHFVVASRVAKCTDCIIAREGKLVLGVLPFFRPCTGPRPRRGLVEDLGTLMHLECDAFHHVASFGNDHGLETGIPVPGDGYLGLSEGGARYLFGITVTGVATLGAFLL